MGKTTLIRRFADELSDEYDRKYDMTYVEKIVTVGDKSIKLVVWD